MIKSASNEELRSAFEMHLEETKGHVERLEQVMEILGMPAKGKTCKAMQGIIEEGKEVMEEDAEEDVMDAALIGAARRWSTTRSRRMARCARTPICSGCRTRRSCSVRTLRRRSGTTRS